MGKKIVSANYMDRESPVKWLVRDVGAPIGSAVPVGAMICKGVRFCSSYGGESGFGCNVIAECDSVDVAIAATGGMPLKFKTDTFTDAQGRWVNRCDELHLFMDGSMAHVIYPLVEQEPAPVAEVAGAV